MLLLFFFFWLVFLSSPVFAQIEEAYLLNLPGAKTAERTEFRVTHRFYGTTNKEFLGIDEGANVGLGLTFNLRKNLDLSLERSRLNKEYLLGSKISLINNPHFALSLFTGGTYKADSTITKNKAIIFSQLILTSFFFDHQFLLSFIPSYALATDINDQQLSENNTFAVGTAVSFSKKISKGYIDEIIFAGEYIPIISGHHLRYPYLSVGIKIKTWGHYFSFMLTDSFFTSPQYLIGSDSADLYFGFNISRKF